MNGRAIRTGLVIVAMAVSSAWGQMGRRWPSEKKGIADPVTGIPLTFLTTDPGNDAKIYQTHQQWTCDGQWLVFRADRGTGVQAFAVHEETGAIVQVTQTGYMGMLCNAHKSMKLFFMRNPEGGSERGGRSSLDGGQQIVEIDLARLLADSEAGDVKAPSEYERLCGAVPSGLRTRGDMAVDANDEIIYFSVTGPDTAQLSEGQTPQPAYGPRNLGAGPSGLRRMNLRTGEVKVVCNVGFQIGHVQTNPVVPGEIIFCWETGGKAPQRTWLVNGDGTGLRPLYPEAPYEWVTHEAAFNRDEVALALTWNRMPGVPGSWGIAGTPEHPTGLAIVNLRTREMRIAGQVPPGDPGRSNWHVAGSPDGRWAAFDDFRYRLWLIDRRTSETVLLADLGHKTTAQDHIHPTFSLDSTRIQVQCAMLAPDGRVLDICVVPVPESWLDRTYSVKLTP